MIESSEALFALVLLNIFSGLFLYCITMIYRLIIHRHLDLLGNYFSFIIPFLIFLLLFLKFLNLAIFPIVLIGSLCLIYDFFQNYKKSYLCSCSSLLLTHLCAVVMIGSFLDLKLTLFIYLLLANFCLFLLCFGKLEVFKNILYLSAFVTLLTFIPSWLDIKSAQIILISYLVVYAIFAFLVFLLIGKRLIFCLARVMKQK